MRAFVQNKLPAMQWLNRLIGKGFSAPGLDISGSLGGSVHFFIYDVIWVRWCCW